MNEQFDICIERAARGDVMKHAFPILLSDRLRMGLQIGAFVIHDVHVDTTDARPHGRDRAENEALSD